MLTNLTLTLRRLSGLLVILCAVPAFTFGQAESARKNSLADMIQPVEVSGVEAAPGTVIPTTAPIKNNDDQPEAMWDIQFNYGLEDSVDAAFPSASGGLAGVVFTGTEFWVSDWGGGVAAQDTLYRFSPTGQYIGIYEIITGIRGMTFDGTNVVIAVNTTTLRRVNPATGAVVGTFTVPASVGGVRWITYNAAGNSGAGSFYVGNFNTSIFEISNPASGAATVLSTITAATHGLSGMYGAVYDATSTNGPFMWVFTQTDPTGAGATATIAQLQMPTGVQNNFTRDVNADFPGAAGLAGGITIAQLPGFTQRSLVAVNQGESMVGYELNYVFTAIVDGTADSLDVNNGLTQWPLSQNGPFKFSGRVANLGNQPLPASTVKVSLLDSNLLVLGTPAVINTNALAPSAKQVFTNPSNLNVSSKALYFGEAVYSPTGDTEALNDTFFTAFVVTDSTMARDFADFGFNIGNLGVGAAANQNKKLGQKFPLTQVADLTSISFLAAAPPFGEQVSASVYSVSAAGVIGATPLASTAPYTYTAADTLNGVFLTLPLTSGPLTLVPGEFLIAINELGESTAGIGTTTRIYQANKMFAKWDANASGAWTDVAAFGFRIAYVIRPNFGVSCASAVFTVSAQPTDACFGINNGVATASVIGAGTYTYAWSNGQTTQTISNLAPGSYTVTATDAQGCSKTQSVQVGQTAQIAGTITVNDAFTVNGGSASISGISGGSAPFTYSWSTVPPQTNDTATNLAAGQYVLIVTDSRGCSNTFIVNVRNRVSVDPQEIGIRSLNVFPNPSQGVFTVEMGLANSGDISFSLLDLQGRVLMTRETSAAATLTETFDLGDIAAGAYLLGIKTSEGQIFRYLTVE
ncbi:MAG: T9SS C-terminal target domain-containing protein [Bacteroidetes bacterium]|nr:MAG: T9SS C-terminal target domain-containing protein [Bacteroidota bacterium]